MAFLREPTKLKNTILAFVKHLVSKSIYRAIEIILNPCCQLEISDIDITCTDTDEATIVLTFTKGISFPGTINFILTSDLDGLVAEGTYISGSETLTIESAVVATAGAAEYTLTLLPITNSADNQGVWESATITTTNPNCA